MSRITGTMKAYKIYKGAIAALVFFICCYLFILNTVITVALTGVLPSQSNFVLDFVAGNIAATAAVIAAIVFAVRSSRVRAFADRLTSPEKYDRVSRILIYLIFAIGALWSVAIYSCGQHFDSLEIMQAVYGMSWNDFTKFGAKDYFSIYPNNIGTTMIFYVFSKFCGVYNYLALMLLNSVFIALVYYDLSKITVKMTGSRKLGLAVLAAGIFFLPVTGLSVLVYGTVPGLFLAVRSLRFIMDYSSTHSRKSAVIAALLIALATVIKNNYIIFIIAFVIYLAFEALRTGRAATLIPIAVMVVSFLVMSSGMKIIARSVTGCDISGGAAKLSWIAMGMQESSGTYNGYNSDNYVLCDFDADREAALASGDIRERINEFTQSPTYALNFYTRKVAIEWTNPLFNAFEPVASLLYESDNIPEWVWYTLSPRGIAAITSAEDVFLSLVYLGTAAFVIASRKEKLLRDAVLPMLIFVGGYTFHLIWEAGSTYATPYVILLLPVALTGLLRMSKSIAGIDLKHLKAGNTRVSGAAVFYCLGAGAVFLLACAGLGTMRTMLAQNRSLYKQYLADNCSDLRNVISDGTYIIKPADEAYQGEGVTVSITGRCSRSRIEIMDSGLYLTESDSEEDGIGITDFSYSEDQSFVILKNSDDTYSIVTGDGKALCYEPEGHMFGLSEFTDYLGNFSTEYYGEYIASHPEQTWKIVSAG